MAPAEWAARSSAWPACPRAARAAAGPVACAAAARAATPPAATSTPREPAASPAANEARGSLGGNSGLPAAAAAPQACDDHGSLLPAEPPDPG
eukprot:4657223-Alexandrium_andersonii.AAC.1